MTPKVSVVVPTYAPRERIDGLVRSLEAQTMPVSDFEVIFVDDGSPDDTWQRLQRIRDRHENVRIERIANSGWPSRPRNVGLELARGEYVLFMDHDDELYPQALEAGYAMAARTGADVLNGKETRTDQAKWALEVYTANADNVVDRQDIHPLIPTNPHKLFRRALLMERGIRFPEGRRVLWEDVFFALDLAPHVKVISVLADTPFYHWVRGRVTASSSYTKNREEYWRWVREIVIQTNEKLAGPRLRDQHRLMLLHQYRSRVLTPLGSSLFSAPDEERDMVFATVTELLRDHIAVDFDAYLTPTQLGRAVLARAARWDLLEKLVAVDAGLVGIGATTSVEWRDGVMHVTAESRWAATHGEPLAIRFDGDRIVRDLPAEVADALPDAAVDMSAAIAAADSTIAVRDRATAVVWAVPTECRQRIDLVDGRPELVVVAAAFLHPATTALGRPLSKGTWDLSIRNSFLGAINQRGLRTRTSSRCAVKDRHVYIAYRNKSGMLSLDIDQTNRSLAGSAKFDAKRAWTSIRRGWAVRLGLPGATCAVAFGLPFYRVHVVDDTVIEGATRVGRRATQPARIVARDGSLWLESTLRQRPGRFPLVMESQGRRVDTGVEVTISARGRRVAFRPKQ